MTKLNNLYIENKNLEVLGIDIGGSGMKAAIVDLNTGKFVGERERIDTPQPATPEMMAKVVKQLQKHFNWKGKIGIGFPAAIVDGVVKTASNIHTSWIGINIEQHFEEATKCEVRCMNDVDVAGSAEVIYGAGRKKKGTIAMIALGTGIGTALFHNKKLFPNTELGHIQLAGKIAEDYAANSVRKEEDLSWKKWGKRLNEYLQEIDKLVWPEIIIIGGGVSKYFEEYEGYLNTRAKVIPARLKNHAGIIGAAAQFLE